MKFFEILRDHSGTPFIEISGPDDGYQGCTLLLQVDGPIKKYSREIAGRILFPEHARFVFAGSLTSLRILVRRAATAREFLSFVVQDDRFDAERD